MFKKFLIGVLTVVAFMVTTNLALAFYDFGSAILKVGSKGQYVTTLQNLVGATPVDGSFGPITKAKVVAWQKAHGLIADGLFGPISKDKANETGTNFGVGCTNASGFSTTTGFACSSLSAHTFPTGCTNASGFSITTGYSCLTGLPATTTPIVRGGGSSGSSHHRDTIISATAIAGVTAPVTGATPVSDATDGTGYTVTSVTWAPTGTFASNTVYTATITIAPASGYTLTGITHDQFTIADSTSDTNPINSGVITAVFPATATTIVATAIAGVTAPVTGATPVTTVTAGTGYTGTVTWNGTPSTFASATSYTATITLTATSGYTLTGVTADQFTIADSTSDTNPINSGVITAVFPATAPIIATVSTIVEGAVDPIVTVTGTNFKPTISIDDLQLSVGTYTGLTFGPITYVSATTITVAYIGTAVAAYGNTATIQAKTSAFYPAGTSASNELTVRITAAPVTGMAFALTTPTPGVGNSLTGGGAITDVNVVVVKDTSSVVITGTKTITQTVVIVGYDGVSGHEDSLNVTTTGTDTAPIYTVNITTPGYDAHLGGEKEFEFIVSEEGKSDVVYNVNIQIAWIADVTSAVFTTTVATTTITITLAEGSFKTGTIDKDDFNFGGPNAVAIAAGTFNRVSDTIVTITPGIHDYFFARNLTDNDNTVTVLGATQATQVTTVTAVAS